MLLVPCLALLAEHLSQISAAGVRVWKVVILMAFMAEKLSTLLLPMEGADIRTSHKFLAVGCAGDSPGNACLHHCPVSCSKWSISEVIISLPFIFFTAVITWRLTNQNLCSFGGKTHTSAISHILIGSGNKNSKLSSDLKLLVWQLARRCHQP